MVLTAYHRFRVSKKLTGRDLYQGKKIKRAVSLYCIQRQLKEKLLAWRGQCMPLILAGARQTAFEASLADRVPGHSRLHREKKSASKKEKKASLTLFLETGVLRTQLHSLHGLRWPEHYYSTKNFSSLWRSYLRDVTEILQSRLHRTFEELLLLRF